MTNEAQLLRPGQALLAVALGAATVLSGAALLAVSGALITGAAQRPESLLVLLPLITCVRLFAIMRAAFRYAERLVAHDLTLRLLGQLRARLLRSLVPLAPAALHGVRGGELLARIRADVDALQGVFVQLLAPVAVAVLAGGIAVGLTAVVSPPLALVLAGLLLVLGVLVPAWSGRAGRTSAAAVERAEAAFGAETLDLVRGLTDHLAGDGGRTALAGLDRELARQQAAERAVARLGAGTTLAREAVPGLGVLAALWLVGWDVARGSTDPILLAAAVLGVLGAFEAVANLGRAWASAGAMRAAAERVQALDRQVPAVTDPERPEPKPADSDLRFEDVWLTYPGATQPALGGVSLCLDAGEKLALVGPSGGGKSTLLSLVWRVRDPDAGAVRLGGVDLRALALADVRAGSAWAAQSPQLVSGSIADNLRLGRPAATDAELTAALVQVGLDEVVAAERLRDWIGDGGDRLSAGERARVGVARALLSPAPILLLDEPTAHLDQAGATRLLDVISHQDRAVLLVTHTPELLGPGWRVVTLAEFAVPA